MVVLFIEKREFINPGVETTVTSVTRTPQRTEQALKTHTPNSESKGSPSAVRAQFFSAVIAQTTWPACVRFNDSLWFVNLPSVYEARVNSSVLRIKSFELFLKNSTSMISAGHLQSSLCFLYE